MENGLLNEGRLEQLLEAVSEKDINEAIKPAYRCTTFPTDAGAREDIESVGLPPLASVERDSSRDLEHMEKDLLTAFVLKDPSLRNDRYSSGFNALYAGISRETAELEISHYARNVFWLEEPAGSHEFHVIQLSFDGTHKDITDLSSDFPELVESSDYRYCHKVGSEVRDKVDGLVFPSARHLEQGEHKPNIVVFEITAVRPSKIEGYLTCDVSTTESGERVVSRRFEAA